MSSSGAPPLRSRTSSMSPATSAKGSCAQPVASAASASSAMQARRSQPAAVAGRGAALDQAVGEEQQAPAAAGAPSRAPGQRGSSKTPSGGPVRRRPDVGGAPSPSSTGGGCPALRTRRRRAVGRDRHGRDVAKISSRVALVHEHLLQRRAARARRRRRRASASSTPPAGNAEGRLVGAVAADVADHEVHARRRACAQVVEVPAEQRALAAGAVAGADAAAPRR